jgi:hypothetical protein
MNPELKTQLLSNVIVNTKPESLTFKASRSTLTVNGLITMGAGIAALVGILMLAFGKLKLLF